MARLQFVDGNGKKRDIWRKCESRTHAREVLNLLREVEDNGIRCIDTASMTFDELSRLHRQTSMRGRARPELMRRRQQLSEPPFGTIKRAMGQG